ncbi:MAG: hypothetical protein RIT81_30220 [Deltaproteobacteria bacterium]
MVEPWVVIVLAALGVPALAAVVFRALIEDGESRPAPEKALPPPQYDDIGFLARAVEDEVRSLTGSRRVRGRIDGIRIEARYDESDDVLHLSADGLREGIGVAPYRALVRNLVDAGYVTGDAAFDDKYRLQGGEALVRAALDDDTRAALVDGAPNVTVDGGRLEARVAGPFAPLAVRQLVHTVVALGRAFSAPDDTVVDRIASHVVEDAVAGVRRASLLYLVANEPTHPATRRVVLAALDDSSWNVRASAASAAAGLVGASPREGGSGAGRVTEVCVALAADPVVDSATRARMLWLALPGLDQARRVAVTQVVAESTDDALAVAVCGVVERYGMSSLADHVRALFAVESEAVRCAAASAVTVVGDASFTGLLVAQMEREPGDDLAEAVCRALGEHGAAESIAPLLAFSGRLLRARRVRDAAQSALQAVRARLGEHAGEGQLSVVAQEGGRVSVAGEDGALSIDPNDP